jgi:adenylate cyclase
MTTRRLAAILAADVVGSSRLIEADEGYALTAIREVLHDVLVGTAASHGCRLVKTMGDGALLEFASPVAAVTCATAVQSALAERVAIEPEDRRVLLRIGVNLGDVVAQTDGDLYGDGVNIAARLESIASPGGIAISGKVHEELQGKVNLLFEDQGEHSLKNVARPVRVYALGGSALGAKAIGKPLPLPDKPSIAVLPFTNMSGDPDQEFLADGMVEEIIAALSRVRSFFVISRNSTFTYKGRAVDPREVGRELGVRYVLEGSVRRAGNRLRIMTQLVDAGTGNQVWSERHDGDVTDVFDLQDTVTEAVVGSIAPTIRLSEIERAKRKRPENLDAYDCTTRALPALWSQDQESIEEGLRLAERAISLDPGYALPKALASWCYAQRVAYMRTAAPEREIAIALKLAEEAASLDSRDPLVLTALSAAYAFARDHERAAALIEKALALDPNSAWAWTRSGFVNVHRGKPDLGIRDFQRAIRLSPLDPMHFYTLFGIGHAFLGKAEYDEAAEWFERGLREKPDAFFAYRPLTACYAHANRLDEAKRALEVLIQAYPDLTISKVLAASAGGKGPRELIIEGLRKAGLPE